MDPTFRYLRLFATLSLVAVFLVICAGATVRATGAGMGCPDWPYCFGYLIPPTQREEVSWQPQRRYAAGQMIIHSWGAAGEAEQPRLLVAQRDFITGEAFDAANWSVYQRHDYAIFNPLHTWIEYINRLLGALSGLPILLTWAAAGVLLWRRRAFGTFLIASAALLTLGFIAWLGKVVVDQNLRASSITGHMLGSLVLIGLLLALVRRGSVGRSSAPACRWWLAAVIAALLVQILLGTQVREEVDILKRADVVARAQWLDHVGSIYLVHRLWSWLLLGLLLTWSWRLRRDGIGIWELPAAWVLVLVQVAAGVWLGYGGFPAVMQPAHLVAALLLFGVLGSAWFKLRGAGTVSEPSTEAALAAS